MPKVITSEGTNVIIYSWGLVACSACAPKEMDIEEITKQVNALHPTGITSKWKPSKDEKFSDGQTNPCSCDKQPTTRKHYLFNC